MEAKWALVTGASSGIGKAIAEVLAEQKWNIFLVSNQPQELESVAAALATAYQVKTMGMCLDLTLTDAVAQIMQRLSNENIHIRFLVNNAGMLLFSEVVEADEKKREAILKLHMNVPVALSALIGSEMKTRRSGWIINVSSISAVMPYPGISLYGPTKTFLRYFSRALRSEMAYYDVRVTCLIPGATATGLYDPQKIDLGLAKKIGVMQTPEYVARKAVAAVLRNQAECIPGWLNKLTVFVVPLLPHWLIMQIRAHTGVFDRGLRSLG